MMDYPGSGTQRSSWSRCVTKVRQRKHTDVVNCILITVGGIEEQEMEERWRSKDRGVV